MSHKISFTCYYSTRQFSFATLISNSHHVFIAELLKILDNICDKVAQSIFLFSYPSRITPMTANITNIPCYLCSYFINFCHLMFRLSDCQYLKEVYHYQIYKFG